MQFAKLLLWPTLYPSQEADPEAASSYNFALSDADGRARRGRGKLTLTLVVDGRAANSVTLFFQ